MQQQHEVPLQLEQAASQCLAAPGAGRSTAGWLRAAAGSPAQSMQTVRQGLQGNCRPGRVMSCAVLQQIPNVKTALHKEIPYKLSNTCGRCG